MLIRAALLCACLPLVAACPHDAARERETPASTAPALPATVPVAAPTAPQLPELDRARLAYMFEAAELVKTSWPGMTPASTCLMLITQTAQWVVNCDTAPRGFERATGVFRGRAIYLHEGGQFERGGQTLGTDAWLATTPAAAHVRAASKERDGGGLPGNDPWLVIGSLDALAAYHPAFPRATTEAWVSVAVHELVHTHQLRAPGFAPYLADIEAGRRSPEPLRALYERDDKYRALVAREYALLVAAAREPANKTLAQRALRRWRTLYHKRVAVLAAQPSASSLVEDDALFSYLEGVARWVESDFLARAAQHPTQAPTHDERFHAYDQFLARGYAGSPNRQLDAQYFYAIGYHLCILLDRLDSGWKSIVHSRSHWLYSLVDDLAAEG